MPEIERLFRFMRKNPPVRLLVAGYLGFKPPSDEPVKYTTAEEFARIIQLTGGRIPGVGPVMR